MVFNDFHITPSMPEEVAELYGGQKMPCLLFYTQASPERAKPGCCARARRRRTHSRTRRHRQKQGRTLAAPRRMFPVGDFGTSPIDPNPTHPTPTPPPWLPPTPPQVEVVRRAAELAPAQPVPVLSPEGFLALCRMPPLQVSLSLLLTLVHHCPVWPGVRICKQTAHAQLWSCMQGRWCARCQPAATPTRAIGCFTHAEYAAAAAQGPKVRLHKPTFAPLLAIELPQPGSLFALDAEFVAYSPPEKALLRWVLPAAR